MSAPDAPAVPRRAERPAALAAVLERARSLLADARPFGRDGNLVQLLEVDVVLRGALLGILRCPVYRVAAEDPPLPAALEKLGAPVLTDVFRGIAPPGGEPDAVEVELRCEDWLRGIAVAGAARWNSNQGEYDRPDEAYLAGLARALVRSEAETVPGEDFLPPLRLGPRVEAVVVGSFCEDHGDGDCARADGSACRLGRVVARSERLVDGLRLFAEGPTQQPPPEGGELAAVAEAVKLELAHAAALLGYPPLPPPELLASLVAAEVDARRRLEPPAAKPTAVARIARLSGAHHALAGLRSNATVQEILERGISLVHEGLDFDRVILLEREHGNPNAARVRAVACRTKLEGTGARSLAEVPVPGAGALLRAFEGSPPQRSILADAPVARFLGGGAFVAAPLRAGSALVGAVVADHIVTRRESSDDDLASLALAAEALGLVLENAALQAEGKTLRALADKDALTGINNRRNVLEILRREIDRARRYGKPLSIALIDVDHFKFWNDHHGHQVGDMVLQTVAQLISSASREIDACGRYGGEEFLVVLPETLADQAYLYAERLRASVETHGADLAGTFPGAALTISTGITQLLPRGDDADRMIERADAALYASKDQGRNRTCVEMSPPELRTQT